MEERILLKVSFNGNDAGSFITVKAFLPSAIVLLTTAWPLIDIRECPTVREREGKGGRGREGIEGGERGERGEREGREERERGERGERGGREGRDGRERGERGERGEREGRNRGERGEREGRGRESNNVEYNHHTYTSPLVATLWPLYVLSMVVINNTDLVSILG